MVHPSVVDAKRQLDRLVVGWFCIGMCMGILLALVLLLLSGL